VYSEADKLGEGGIGTAYTGEYQHVPVAVKLVKVCAYLAFDAVLLATIGCEEACVCHANSSIVVDLQCVCV